MYVYNFGVRVQPYKVIAKTRRKCETMVFFRERFLENRFFFSPSFTFS